MELGFWSQHPRNIDPSALQCLVRLDGKTFEVNAIQGAGWPMTIRQSGERSWMWNEMASWEDWADVEAKIRKHLVR